MPPSSDPAASPRPRGPDERTLVVLDGEGRVVAARAGRSRDAPLPEGATVLSLLEPSTVDEVHALENLSHGTLESVGWAVTARPWAGLQALRFAVLEARRPPPSGEPLFVLLEESVEADLEGDLARSNAALRAAQAELSSAGRLAAFASMAGGLAHELNNPLTTILGFTQLLLEDRSLGRAHEDLERIAEAAQRVKHVVEEVGTFARLSRAEFREHDLKQVLLEALETLQTSIASERVDLALDLDPSMPPIACEPEQLRRAFVHVLDNAVAALSQSEQRFLLVSTRLQEDRAVIVIEDSGSGVAEALRERMFEPFFTTKPVGSGRGLGLSVAYALTRAHEGGLRYESRRGGGARFLFELPTLTHVPAPKLGPHDALVERVALWHVGEVTAAALRRLADDHRVDIVEVEAPSFAGATARTAPRVAYDVHVCALDASEDPIREGWRLVEDFSRHGGGLGRLVLVSSRLVGHRLRAFAHDHEVLVLYDPLSARELTDLLRAPR